MLVRAFPWLPGAAAEEPGGPLHVARLLQGGSRHDNPAQYGVLYASRDPVSAAAERLRSFRRWELADADFLRPDGARYALITLDDEDVAELVDLDDPSVLTARNLRPSMVATRERRATRRMALDLYEDGADGISWWSTIEASWTNVSLFAERCLDRLVVTSDPEPLGVEHAAVRDAAAALGIRLSA